MSQTEMNKVTHKKIKKVAKFADFEGTFRRFFFAGLSELSVIREHSRELGGSESHINYMIFELEKAKIFYPKIWELVR